MDKEKGRGCVFCYIVLIFFFILEFVFILNRENEYDLVIKYYFIKWLEVI